MDRHRVNNFANGSSLTAEVPETPKSETTPAVGLARLSEAVTAAPSPEGAPRRVLLSEDSSVNRNVAAQILRNLGYQVDAVSNGGEALRAIQHSSYDLIILDCETPEIDGYEATQAIRRLPGGIGESVPIIGLTGGSTSCDRAKRQAAGMNDYIAKPFRLQTVASVLARWDPAAHRTDAPPLAVDRDVLASLAELASDRNPGLLEELIELFLGSTPLRIAELGQALKRKDVKAIGSVAHHLRGSSGQLGAAQMERTCASIETLVRAGTLKTIRELLNQLQMDFERVQRDIRTFSEERRAGSPKREPPPVSSVRCDLGMLRVALEGKCLLAVHNDLRVMAELEIIFRGTGCTIRRIRPVDLPLSGDLLFWGADVEELARLVEQGFEIPVIVLARYPNAALLDRVQQLGADFVLEPFRAGDLQLRTLLALGNGPRAKPRAPSPVGSEPQELLVAEDDSLITRFLASHLEGAGFRVTLVVDGAAALEALDQRQFAVVILDINMPKMDGFGVLNRIRLRTEPRRTPVLMLSARLQEHDIVKAFDLGADDYVTKPFSPLELISRVRRLSRCQ